MCTLGKMVPSASRNSELEGILTWYQVCSENGCKWLQHLRSANITQNVSSSFDKENIIQWEFEKDQLPLIYIYIVYLYTLVPKWWLDETWSPIDFPPMIRLPWHTRILMTCRRRTWQTPSACHMATHCGHIMRVNGKAKCWKQTTTWATSQRQILGKGQVLGVFFCFKMVFSKSGIAGCLRKDRQSGGEQNLVLLVEANMFGRLLDDHSEGFSLICICV